MGCFGQLGCREKKPPNCHKYVSFWGGFFNFSWAKNNYFSIRTKKLHSIKAKKIFKKLICLRTSQKKSDFGDRLCNLLRKDWL